MKKYWKYMAFAAVALLGVGAAACSDDEGDTSWSATYAYLVPEHLGILDKAVTLSHTAEGISGDASLVFSVGLNKVSSKDLTFTFDVVTSETLPGSEVELSLPEVTIPAGELVSAPITLSVPDWSFEAENRAKVEYTVAVSVAQTAGVELGRQNLLTLAITKNAYLNLVAEAPENSVEIDCTNWVCSKMDGMEGDANVLKGTAGGDIASNTAPWWVAVDMGATHTLTGARTTHWSSYYAPTSIEVETSEDGTNWTSHGVLPISGGTQNWSLIEPVACRFVRYTALAPNSRTDITSMRLYEAE